ncbi:phosphotransferase family protein [Nocardiopsis potens]|uniref:phosphotransferase family protein n=1 Tax=Nocardiopsis potens TaxID=1246458 RepID=UPI00034740C5|nr:phosphotransferase [Nocardiopsis potens]
MTPSLKAEDESSLRRWIMGVRYPPADVVPGTDAVVSSAEDEIDPAELGERLRAAGAARGPVLRTHRYTARRPVVRAEFADGPPLIVKWPHYDADLNSDNERRTLEMLDSAAEDPVLRGALPRLLGGDADGLTVIEAVPGAETMAEASRSAGGADGAHLLHFGAVLGLLHGLPVPAEVRDDPGWRPHVPIPDGLHLTPDEYAHGCGLDFDHYAASLQEVEPELLELRSTWRARTLVHFDLSPDNVLLDATGAAEHPVTLIDWEMAGLGDPAYDLGHVLGHMVSGHLRDASGAGGAARPAGAARVVQGYRLTRDLPAAEVARAVRFCGLIQLLSALFRVERIGSLGEIGRLSLRVGQRILRDPEAMADTLFGPGLLR